eukprot:jgi/Psemu1/289750/fgenesh1_pg.399_\
MEILDDWGDHVPYHYRNIYKEDWNWNPIDEAPVQAGSGSYWPEYAGVDEDLKEGAWDRRDDDDVVDDEYEYEYEYGGWDDEEEEEEDGEEDEAYGYGSNSEEL